MNPVRIPRAFAIRILRRTGQLDRFFDLRRRARAARDQRRRRAGVPSRLMPALRVDGAVAVLHGGVWSLAQEHPTTTAGETTAANLGLAVDLLDRSGVAHFFVPIDDARQVRLGVALEDRPKVLEAVSGWLPDGVVYVRPAGTATGRLVPIAPGLDTADLMTRLAEANLWWVWQPRTDPTHTALLGIELATQIEFWSPVADTTTAEDVAVDESTTDEADAADDVATAGDRTVRMRARRHNALTNVMVRAEATTDEVVVHGRRLPAHRDAARLHASRTADFPVDLVYTWVDDGDPAWMDRRDAARGVADPHHNVDGSIGARYRNRNELLYSFRSVAMNVPFARHIYLVTDRQCPAWLDTSAPGVTVVDHRDIFRPDDCLPTFNSHAIESRLHRIPGLAEHYLYVNDDVFFGRPVEVTTFFTPTGMSRFFPSRARVPIGPVSADEPSVTSAAKNGRDLLFGEFGAFPVNKMKHTPHPQRRSTVLDIEDRYPEAMARVGRNQFRSTSDISLASWLQHRHGEMIGNAVSSNLRYAYLSLAEQNLPDRLDALLAGNYDAWCINDVGVEHHADVDRLLFEFLERAFPFPSPWELPQR